MLAPSDLNCHVEKVSERSAVIALSIRLAAEQVVSEAAIATDRGERRAELLSALEIGQRRLRLTVGDGHRAHSGLRQRTLRIDLVGAGEEAGRGLGITELEEYIAGLESEIARARAEIAAKQRQRSGAEALFKR